MLSFALLFLAACLDIGMSCDDFCTPGWKYFEGKCYDKCRPGWKFFQGKCYGFGETEVTWANAQMICRALGARLVEIKTSEENEYVAMLAVMKQDAFVWISATDIFHDGMWEWTSAPNTFLSSFTNWEPDEPNNYQEAEDCAHQKKVYEWNDKPCKMNASFVCVEIPITVEPETKKHTSRVTSSIVTATDVY